MVKRILSLVLALVLLIGCLPMGASAANTVTPSQVLAEARRYVGVKYVWGGKTPSGFDCTGFVAYVYGNLGTGITYSQVYSRTVPGTRITGSANFQPGDIIFGESSPGVGHTGICTGSGKWIDCGSSKGVSERSYSWMSKISFAIRPSCLGSTPTPPPHTHSWGNGIITTAPTETSTGIRTYTCEGCGQTKTETVPKLPHTHKWDNGKVTKHATVESTGTMLYICTGCGQTKTETIPMIMNPVGKCGNNVTWAYNNSTKTLTLSGTGSTYDYQDKDYGPWYSPETGYAGGSVEKVIISPGITRLGDYLLYGIWQPTSVSIPTSVTSIGVKAFYGWKSLESVIIPKGVIGESAFGSCDKLKYITLGEGVTEIGEVAFSAGGGSDGCIETITIPGTATKISWKNAFGVNPIREINVSDNHSMYSSNHGVVYNKALTELVYYPKGITDTTLVIPSSVKVIKEYAVSNNYNLREIIVPEGVTTLETGAFWCNNQVTTMTLPKSLKNISENALYTHSGSLKDIYYAGTESDWNAIYSKSWGLFDNVTIHFVEDDPEFDVPGEKPTVAGFTDVFEGDYYADPVKWAVEQKITSGTSATTFSPKNSCTRGQAVTFLWRAAGEPEPQNSEISFTDVKAGDYYEKAVRWAVEKGITSGTSATRFSPKATCTRAQIVTFLWRAQGSPAAAGNSFTDVKAGDYYENAVSWAVGKEITAGTSAEKFSPSSNCTRGQIVTFLYRYSN